MTSYSLRSRSQLNVQCACARVREGKSKRTGSALNYAAQCVQSNLLAVSDSAYSTFKPTPEPPRPRQDPDFDMASKVEGQESQTLDRVSAFRARNTPSLILLPRTLARLRNQNPGTCHRAARYGGSFLQPLLVVGSRTHTHKCRLVTAGSGDSVQTRESVQSST